MARQHQKRCTIQPNMRTGSAFACAHTRNPAHSPMTNSIPTPTTRTACQHSTARARGQRCAAAAAAKALLGHQSQAPRPSSCPVHPRGHSSLQPPQYCPPCPRQSCSQKRVRAPGRYPPPTPCTVWRWPSKCTLVHGPLQPGLPPQLAQHLQLVHLEGIVLNPIRDFSQLCQKRSLRPAEREGEKSMVVACGYMYGRGRRIAALQRMLQR